jgi:glutathione synthase/RimK-type ligase-like ATP-grasp enzyme
LLVKALVARGARAEWVVWNDPDVDWTAYELIVVRCTWDYHERVEEFRAWVQSRAVATRLVNTPTLVLGNLHKGYLADLGELAVPTVVVPAGMTIDLARLRWPSSVVKPAVGAGGIGAVREATQADLHALTLAPEGAVDAVVQPYLGHVEELGEISVISIGGQLTHAVRKLPAAGEFRIHDHWGGTVEMVEPDAHVVEVTLAALAALRSAPVYARVDLLFDGDDPRVVELELVKPYLYLEMAPEAAERLAGQLVRRAADRS